MIVDSRIEISDVFFIRKKREILKDISWTIKEGERWALIGPNGSGKSTLLSILAGIQWASKGTINFFGNRYGYCYLPDIKKKIFLFQPILQEHLMQDDLTATDIVCTGFTQTLGLYQKIDSDILHKAINYLKDAGLDYLKNQEFRLLSSGEKRRVLFLREKFMNTRLMVFDEPFENLDLTAREKFLLMINNYLKSNDNKKTVIFVSHRLEEIPPEINKVFLLKDGTCFAQGEKDSLFSSKKISALYDWPIHVEKRDGRYYTLVQNFSNEKQ